MKDIKYRHTWDLDNLYPGGSLSYQFGEQLKQLQIEIEELEEKLKVFQSPSILKDASNVQSLINNITDIRKIISQASSFITCLLAQIQRILVLLHFKGSYLQWIPALMLHLNKYKKF